MSLSLTERFPSHLTFDHDPSEQELHEVVGPHFTTTHVVWEEDDECIRVRAPEFPFRRAVTAVLTMLVAMTLAPWALRWVADKPYELATKDVVIYCVVWLVVAPGAIGLLVWAKRKLARLGPGAIVNKRTHELTLPWIERSVPAAQIDRFVDVRGRRHVRGSAMIFQQCGVVFRDDAGGFVFAPFARLVARRLGKNCAARLADFYDRRLQEVTGVVFGAAKR